VDEWIDRFADALGEQPLHPTEVGSMLKLSRDIAHGVERKLAPLSTFLAGLSVGRRTAEGVSRDKALGQVLEVARALLPQPPDETPAAASA
jgi:Domain of unknown function (DUF6457)